MLELVLYVLWYTLIVIKQARVSSVISVNDGQVPRVS